MITVACVLKSGGDFTPDYVSNLYAGVCRNISVPFRFVCLTDMNVMWGESIPLDPRLKGWWAKLTLFLLEPPILYFDLDTILVGSIDPFVELDCDFYMLRGFRHGDGASGIMYINSDLSSIYYDFLDELENGEYFFRNDSLRVKLPSGFYRGDQDYTFPKAKELGDVHYLQDYISGIYSFKRHCNPILPSDARVVCFHGFPRPNQVDLEWVRENWQGHS